MTEKAHATWSASATARNWQCPGALALSQGLPDEESIHAATGTAVHQIAEYSLRDDKEPSEFLGMAVQTKKFTIEIGDDEVNSATTYVDYVRQRLTDAGSDAGLWIEQQFSFASLEPPFDSGGTGDAVIHSVERKNLEIIDLKNGMGVVEVEGNKQGRSYGLGALLKFAHLDVETITVTIVQPRAAHKDGRIRSETFHVAELIEWTAELLQAMALSRQAMDEFEAAGSNTVLLEEWAEKWLRPGACKFCRVEGSCPALRKQALAAAAVWTDDLDQPRIGNAALDTSPEAVNRDLLMIPMLENWIKARRALAHDMAEKGVEFTDFMLVETLGHRKWAADEAKVAHDLVKVCGIDEDKIYDRKLKSPAGIDKILGKRKTLTENMWTKPITGKTLAERSKTTSPAAKSKAELFLDK
jgi:hypothetical protein